MNYQRILQNGRVVTIPEIHSEVGFFLQKELGCPTGV
jgi:hypothetical protein